LSLFGLNILLSIPFSILSLFGPNILLPAPHFILMTKTGHIISAIKHCCRGCLARRGRHTVHVERKQLLTSCVLTWWRHPFTTLCTLHTAYGFIQTRFVLLYCWFVDFSYMTQQHLVFCPYILMSEYDLNGRHPKIQAGFYAL
jgi:hypothetical protein